MRLLLCLCWMLLAAWPAGAQAAGGSASSVAQLSWCATAPELTIDAVATQGCDWHDLTPSAAMRGWDTRAYWLRLSLRNSGAEPQERWLEVGHPQVAHMSLYQRRPPGGWSVRHIGAHTPLAQRGSVEAVYGVLPVHLPAGAEETVWVRMASDTVISLNVVLWQPDEFRAAQQVRQFWISLGVGGMALVFVFSLLMLALTRQAAYGFFAIGQVGQFLVVSVTGGTFQRFFWSQHLPVTSEARDLGALIMVLGMYGFLRAFLPQVQRYPITLALLRSSVYASVVLILAGLLGLDRADPLWFITGGLCGLFSTLISVRAWRDGDRAAGIMTAAFASFFVLSSIRWLVLSALLPYSPDVAMLPFLSIFVCSPLMLLGLIDRTRQLQHELSRVRAESAAQLRFLAQMSHELRSPLDIVLGNAQLLAREARSVAQISGLNSIFDSGRQLLRIIDHILDYARGSAGMLRVEPAPLRLESFLRGIERMARLLAVQRNNQFELKLEGDAQALKALSVEADAERLRQVLGNLLGNAARHTGDGRIALQVRARPLPEDASRLLLTFVVSDTGEGISVQEQERIFRPFERAESRANYGGKGAGLGLAIARQLVELMGGQLTVRSAPGQGASFSFGVPVRRLPQAQETPERLDGFDAGGYEGPRRTVMVVDDDVVGRTVLSHLLEGLGFEVLQAASGAQAVAMLEHGTPPDLVLTDQYMPEGDGWLVLERVAAWMPQVPVVLISAAPPSPPPNWNGQLRFAAHFLRPIDHAQLLARIGDLLDLHWSETQVERMAAPPSVAGEGQHPPGAADAAPMVLPDAAQLRSLAQMVELGQVTAIQEWVQRLRHEQPQCAAFAAHVLDAVNRLDLQALANLLGEHAEARSSSN